MNDETFDKKKLLKGLTDEEVKKQREKYGSNKLSKKETKSMWAMFKDSFKDIWVIVLCAALCLKLILTIIGFIFPELSEGNSAIFEILSIIMAIGLTTGISTFNEYKNTSRSSALQEEYGKTYAKVIRNGKLISILTTEITKNDIILLQAGDKIPVDGLIIDGSIKVSQAALNGESRDENKIETNSFSEADSTDYSSKSKVFMGSVVTAGEAYLLATVLGDESELGKINKSLSEDTEYQKDTTTLKLEAVAVSIGKMGMIAAAITGILNVICGLIRTNEVINVVYVLMLIASSIMLMASIIIAAVPEGLAVLVSLVEGLISEALYRKHVLVQKSAAFADSAYITLVASDKTGTITLGQLTLVENILGNGKIVKEIKDKTFLESITLNNLSKVSEGKAIGSNNMDRALLSYAINYGYNESDLRTNDIKEMSGFDSEKKCATVEMKDGSIYWKGATENIIDKVTHFIDENGRKVVFTQTDRKNLEKVMISQMDRSMKLLSTAIIKDNEVILFAVLCLRDDVRPDARETVEELQNASINLLMITGDNSHTAISIAKEANIYHENTNDIALTNDEIENMSDEELAKIIPNLKVVSRAKPLTKKRIVEVAQSIGEVVGVSGDGINDSPALKKSDTGFAMGDGTSVAQEAGDIVLLNNSLTAIKDCILSSRTMAKSISKFLIFQLTVNVSLLALNILAPILGWIEPFSIVSILYINLIMDVLAGLSFGNEPILERYMKEKPVKKDAKILTPYVKSAIATSSIFIVIGCILLLENAFGIMDMLIPIGCTNVDLYEKTVMFAFFIYSVLFNGLNTRSENYNILEHISENKKFIYIMIGIFIFQTFLLEFGGIVFETVPLNLKAYIVTFLMSFLIIPFDMIRKFIYKRIVKN